MNWRPGCSGALMALPLEDSKFGLRKDSIILLEQVRTIDRSMLKEYIGRVDSNQNRSIRLNITVKSANPGLFVV